MFDAALLFALFATSYLAFACFALAQQRHWRCVADVPDGSPVRQRSLRLAGSVWLLFGLGLAVWRDGAGFGAVLWGTAISLSALGVALTLTWCPHALRFLARWAARLA